MKTKTFGTKWLISSLLLCLAAMPLAQAFYNPSTGRWINRDPFHDLGFQEQAVGPRNFFVCKFGEFKLRAGLCVSC